MKQAKRRVRRRNSPTTSQKTIDRRMRELWVDGFGLVPTGATARHLSMIRTALTRLANDDQYWAGLQQLLEAKQQVAELVNSLKGKP